MRARQIVRGSGAAVHGARRWRSLPGAEGALWGSIKAHGFLPDRAIDSDDAGQFNVVQHGLFWVHAERLVHTLDTFTDEQREAQAGIRELIWSLYRDLKAYRRNPSRQRKAALRARFDRIFARKTGFGAGSARLPCEHASTASSRARPDSSPSTVCSHGFMATSVNCSWCSIGPRFRCTRTDQRTISAVRSPSER